MKIKYLFAILFLAGCVHTDIFNLNRKPASASKDGVLREVSEDDGMTFPKVRGDIILKFVVFPNAQGEWTNITFIDPRTFAFHYEYLATLPEFKGYTFKQIEAVSLKAQGRKVLLGSVAEEMGVSEGQWDPKTLYSVTTAEVLPLNVLKGIEKAASRWIEANLKEANIGIGSELMFRPGPNQEPEVRARLKDFKKANIEVAFADEIEATTVFTEGWGIGRVALLATAEDVEKAIQKNQLSPDVVLVVGSDLRELPPVAAVISSVPLTEASHLVLLAQMYGIPLIYEKGAMASRRSSYGKWAFVQSDSSSYEFFDGLTDKEVEMLRAQRKQNKISTVVNWNTNQILEVANIQPTQVPAYGGKATQFGLIRRLMPGNTRSKALGIPVSYYRQFLKTSTVSGGKTLEKALSEMLGSLSGQSSYMEVDGKMNEIRALMKSAKVDPKLVQSLRAELAKNFPGDKIRLKLRSSSNVEDGAEFNGAGLYESEGACLSGCEKDDFEKGLVKVWSSLYTTRGYWARQRFGVDESKVGMGLLVHAPYKGEQANGVVRFKMTDDGPSAEILGVPGEELSVTNAEQGGLNERVVVSKNNEGTLSIANHRPLKNTPAGRMLMLPKHYTDLTQLMGKLYQAWPNKTPNYEIESEWKLINEGGQDRINIKQVRMVPKVKKSKLASQYRVLTGNGWTLEGAWVHDAKAMPWKVERLNISMDSFTDKEFLGKKVAVKNASVQVLGKVYPLTVGSQKLEPVSTYGHQLYIDLSNPALPPMRLKIYITKTADFFMTNFSPHMYLEFYMRPNARFEWRSSLSASTGGGSVPTLERNSSTYKFSMDGCAVAIKGKSAKRWTQTDNEYRFFDSVSISGILGRPISLSGYPSTNYYLQQHERLGNTMFDLYADPNLTAQEKQQLLKMGGRYLEADGDSILMWDEKIQKSKVIPGCGRESSEPSEGVG